MEKIVIARSALPWHPCSPPFPQNMAPRPCHCLRLSAAPSPGHAHRPKLPTAHNELISRPAHACGSKQRFHLSYSPSVSSPAEHCSPFIETRYALSTRRPQDRTVLSCTALVPALPRNVSPETYHAMHTRAFACSSPGHPPFPTRHSPIHALPAFPPVRHVCCLLTLENLTPEPSIQCWIACFCPALPRPALRCDHPRVTTT